MDSTRVPEGFSRGLEDVMEIGRNGLTSELPQRLEGQAKLQVQTAAEWQRLVELLPAQDCWDLIRGFVLLEEHYGWGQGSVSAGNLLARAFVLQHPHRWSEAVLWLRQNMKSNSWYFTRDSPLSFEAPEKWRTRREKR